MVISIVYINHQWGDFVTHNWHFGSYFQMCISSAPMFFLIPSPNSDVQLLKLSRAHSVMCRGCFTRTSCVQVPQCMFIGWCFLWCVLVKKGKVSTYLARSDENYWARFSQSVRLPSAISVMSWNSRGWWFSHCDAPGVNAGTRNLKDYHCHAIGYSCNYWDGCPCQNGL